MPDPGTEVKTGSEAGTYAEEEVGVTGVDTCAVAEGDVAVAGVDPAVEAVDVGYESTGSLLPQFPQKACPSLASLPQFRQNIRIPFMRFPGQTCSAPSRASERWFWHSLVFALALRKRLRPP